MIMFKKEKTLVGLSCGFAWEYSGFYFSFMEQTWGRRSKPQETYWLTSKEVKEIIQFLTDSLSSYENADNIIIRHFHKNSTSIISIACCPFHEEKTPSCVYSFEKEEFQCFGCGRRGNKMELASKLEENNK